MDSLEWVFHKPMFLSFDFQVHTKMGLINGTLVTFHYFFVIQCGFMHVLVYCVMIGWEVSSYGYHGDDGNIFCASGVGKAYGPTYTLNDTVGCGVNTEDGSVFFTKNGQYLGTFFACLLFTLPPCYSFI